MVRAWFNTSVTYQPRIHCCDSVYWCIDCLHFRHIYCDIMILSVNSWSVDWEFYPLITSCFKCIKVYLLNYQFIFPFSSLFCYGNTEIYVNSILPRLSWIRRAEKNRLPNKNCGKSLLQQRELWWNLFMWIRFLVFKQRFHWKLCLM